MEKEASSEVRNDAPRKKVRIQLARFWTGATFDELVELLWYDLRNEYELIESDDPHILLCGPYGGPPLPQGRFRKVFICCENYVPIMSECDWAFGVVPDDDMNHPRYMKLMWGDASHLVRQEKAAEPTLAGKTKFCTFLYSQKVSYREEFFKALSRYKHVEAAGKSMNNAPPIDAVPGTPSCTAKIEYLKQFKFVIAFENSSAPGYNTEKLYHAIEADSVPIYWGDPEIGRTFNVRRLINAHEFLPQAFPRLPRFPHRPFSLEKAGAPTLSDRLFRRANGILSGIEQRVWAARGFDRLVEEVIRADTDDAYYLSILRQPLLDGNKPPDRSHWRGRWREIFDSAVG